MGQQTNLSFFIESGAIPSRDSLAKALRSLGIEEELTLVTRYPQPTNEWQNRIRDSFPLFEFNRRRMPFDDALDHIDKDKELVISLKTSETGIGKRLIVDLWKAVPEDLAAGCIVGNNDVRIGFHDIFGMTSQAVEEDAYIARAPFSIKLWGYRCPANIDLFREVVDQLPAALEMRQILSTALDQSVKLAVYLNL